MKQGVFVTATDTGVGKTILAGHLAESIRSIGYDAGVMKPVASGCICKKNPVTGEQKLISEDAEILARLSGVTDPLDQIAPLRFREPLAPMIAAEIELRTVDLHCVRQSWIRLSNRHQYMVVEGIGGLMVPITSTYYVLDMIKEFGLPALIVARTGLGTLNHTILTVNALRTQQVKLAGIVMNQLEPSQPGLAEKTNPGVLEKCLDIPVIGTVPCLEDPMQSHKCFNDIAKHLLNNPG